MVYKHYSLEKYGHRENENCHQTFCYCDGYYRLANSISTSTPSSFSSCLGNTVSFLRLLCSQSSAYDSNPKKNHSPMVSRRKPVMGTTHGETDLWRAQGQGSWVPGAEFPVCGPRCTKYWVRATAAISWCQDSDSVRLGSLLALQHPSPVPQSSRGGRPSAF